MVTETSRGRWRRPLMGEHEIGVPTLLFAFLGAPVAWAVHFLVIYFLVALFCTTGWQGAGLAVAVATVAFAAVSVAAGVVAYRRWRERRDGQSWDGAAAEPGGWGTFFLVMGMFGAVLFSALIVAEALPPLFVPTCSEYVSS
jgi:small-conductance mechanosensitive channel